MKFDEKNEEWQVLPKGVVIKFLELKITSYFHVQHKIKINLCILEKIVLFIHFHFNEGAAMSGR